LFDIVHGNGHVEQMAMRRDKRTLVTGTSVAQEYPVVVALHQAGLSTTPPAWIELSSPIISQPFMVTHRVPGRTAGDHAGAFADIQGDPLTSLATVLAQLHCVDVHALSLPGFSDRHFDEAALSDALSHWLQIYHDRGDVADPVLEIAFDWLKVNLSFGVSPAVVVHGDFGFHNILLDSATNSVTLLDWELVHLGSAAEDVARAREGLEGPGTFDRFLDVCVAAGGIRPSDETLSYCDVFRLLRSNVIYRGSIAQFNRGDHGDLRQMSICACSTLKTIRQSVRFSKPT
jgi:aminoglycoside phosphotransferase (APT) family kinase protein